MNKHTPGPWHIGEEHADDVYSKDGVIACVVSFNDEAFANARLIAAAPNLLKELQISISDFDGDSIKDIKTIFGVETANRIRNARAAIAKAKGDSV